tara:strand:+ start:198 stop:599 length:402 start_codon:yes stop_codon:yes gene_type:complete
MTLFAASAHAAACHNPEEDKSQFNQEFIKAYDTSSANVNVTIESNIVQHNASKCCIGICHTFCNSQNMSNDSLLVSRTFENNKSANISSIKYYFDSEFEDTYKNIKLQNFYRSSYSTTPSILKTTLKHRILHI